MANVINLRSVKKAYGVDEIIKSKIDIDGPITGPGDSYFQGSDRLLGNFHDKHQNICNFDVERITLDLAGQIDARLKELGFQSDLLDQYKIDRHIYCLDRLQNLINDAQLVIEADFEPNKHLAIFMLGDAHEVVSSLKKMCENFFESISLQDVQAQF